MAGRAALRAPTLVQLLHEHMNVAPPKVGELVMVLIPTWCS